jgi:hypothetical protein
MATVIAQPTGLGTTDEWGSLTGAATKYEACQTPDDDDATYIISDALSGDKQVFTCAAPSGITTGDTVTQIRVIARWRQNGTNQPSGKLGYVFDIDGGGTQTGTSSTISGIDLSYQDDIYTHSGLSAAWGGGLEFWAENALHRRIRMTSLTVEITYTAAGGGSVVASSMVTPLRLKSKLRGLV